MTFLTSFLAASLPERFTGEDGVREGGNTSDSSRADDAREKQHTTRPTPLSLLPGKVYPTPMTPTPKTQHARIYSNGQVTFPDISYKAFVYPGDEEALAALKSIPGASQVLTWLQENFTE